MQKKINSAVGICVGASTITAVQIEKETNKVLKKIRVLHDGDPKKHFKEILEGFDQNTYISVTGRKFINLVNFPTISEPEATEVALKNYDFELNEIDAVISAGGETIAIYLLDKQKQIIDIITGNKCASGTGEFFLQQIKRMNLSIEEAIKLGVNGEPYTVSGRCSVFCKSDCTHALNKGVPVENVTAGLCKMISQKISELIANKNINNILFIGGLSLNTVIVNNLSEKYNLNIPDNATYFEAFGAAILAFDTKKTINNKLFKDKTDIFNYLPSLKKFEHLVDFKQNKIEVANLKDKYIIGLDVGSTTTKAVLINVRTNNMVASKYLRTNGNPIEASRECYKAILEQLNGEKVKIIGIGVTGSGRQIAGLYSLTDGIINEIIAHATAALHYEKDVDTIIEIGGQDAKYTYIVNSVPTDYAMNEACSAGTGSFIEESALESFNVKVTDIAEKALAAEKAPNFSDQCSAFISSDIKNASHENITQNEILAGLVYSICLNYINRVKGNREIGDKIFMQGGVCYNKAIPLAMAGMLNKNIIVPPEPGLMGAYGVALEINKRLNLGLMHEKEYDLENLIKREVKYKKPFICKGGEEKCDIGCEISLIEIEGSNYPFGGACNKYYNLIYKIEMDENEQDLVALRNELVFEKYAMALPVAEDAISIGINKSFLTHWCFPLYYHFFTKLGFKIIISDTVNKEGFNRIDSALCYPSQISIGFFDNLIEKNPDYYFIPQIEEMHVPNVKARKEFMSTCLFVQGEPFILRQAFSDKLDRKKMLAPTINFNGGWNKGKPAFIETAKKLGVSKKLAEESFFNAVEIQKSFEKEYKAIGLKVLENLKKNPDKIAIVLFGRPYNTFEAEANKGIPKKFLSRGFQIIPYDMLPYEHEKLEGEYGEYMNWESGHKLLRAAQIVERNPQLFGSYITNFLCAPDSILVSYFRKKMGKKPSLTLEIDGHTADAGVNTRVEAFIDIVNNFLKSNIETKNKGEEFKSSEIVMGNKGAYFVDAAGDKFTLFDKNVKVVFASMGDISSKMLAASFIKLGIKAEELPICDSEAFKLGKSVLSGKECIPLIVIIGSLLKYLNNKKDKNEKTVVFVSKTGGFCRISQYNVIMKMMIKERKINNVAILALGNEEKYAGLGPKFTINAWKSIIISDILTNVRASILAMAVNTKEAIKIFEDEVSNIFNSLAGISSKKMEKQILETVNKLNEIKIKYDYKDAPKVFIGGEIFVRKDSFSNQNIVKILAEKGIIAETSSVSEWIYYLGYLVREKLIEPDHNLLSKLDYFITEKVQDFFLNRIVNKFSECKFFKYHKIDISDIIKHAEYIVPPELRGETGLVIGTTFKDVPQRFDGVINIGPFGCMPIRYTEALMNPVKDFKIKNKILKESLNIEIKEDQFDTKIPFLTIESDGTPYSQMIENKIDAFCMQVNRISGLRD